jgi:hypothetical protein
MKKLILPMDAFYNIIDPSNPSTTWEVLAKKVRSIRNYYKDFSGGGVIHISSTSCKHKWLFKIRKCLCIMKDDTCYPGFRYEWHRPYDPKSECRRLIK